MTLTDREPMDAVDSGLSVHSVEIKGLKPPAQVGEHFADVIKAKNETMKTVRDAESYPNEEIPAARGRLIR